MTLTFVFRQFKVMSTIASHSLLNVSETVSDRGLVPKDHQCKEIRYLVVCITAANLYCCSFKYAKQAVYRSFNAIFGKIGRIASDEVVL